MVVAANLRLLYISAWLGLQLSRSFGCACQGARCSNALLFISLRACVPPGIARHAASPPAPRRTAAPEPIAKHFASANRKRLRFGLAVCIRSSVCCRVPRCCVALQPTTAESIANMSTCNRSVVAAMYQDRRGLKRPQKRGCSVKHCHVPTCNTTR